MDDYIKRENAKRAVWGCARDTGIDEAPFEYAEGLLEDVPSEDVAPVRHGMWIEYGESKDGTHNMRCSKCCAGLKSYGHANSYYTKHKYRYCNNCGAKMDEGA